MAIDVLVYSSDRTVRADVRRAVGGRLPGLDEPATVTEAATVPAVLKLLDAGAVDVAVFDGEATPAGGMGLARQVKDEVEGPPPILLLVARPADAWLATWSGADAVLPCPVDPIELPKALAGLVAADVAA